MRSCYTADGLQGVTHCTVFDQENPPDQCDSWLDGVTGGRRSRTDPPAAAEQHKELQQRSDASDVKDKSRFSAREETEPDPSLMRLMCSRYSDPHTGLAWLDGHGYGYVHCRNQGAPRLAGAVTSPVI